VRKQQLAEVLPSQQSRCACTDPSGIFLRVTKTLRYRLFNIGTMPEKLRAEIEADEVLFVGEGISVTVRRHGKAPGYCGGATGMFSGAFAVTKRRIIASISSSVMVDAPYDGSGASKAMATLTEEGLSVSIDASINPQCSGEIEMTFKQKLSADNLARFPQKRVPFNFPPDLVPKMFGVPA
jgi:hypothetical protein